MEKKQGPIDISSKNAFDVLNEENPRTFNPGPKPLKKIPEKMIPINRPPRQKKNYNVFKRIK